ncbi:hypothetical protein SAY87_004170 [Trapa incisa]|uniref:Uncharacterized protein n=1 Tax=Trapa incisa TaxID=236973 RepID=A0AAN7JPJ8_9MYRT|nr:hypothetical protein SAY87_004170 [Trapa incisa]
MSDTIVLTSPSLLSATKDFLYNILLRLPPSSPLLCIVRLRLQSLVCKIEGIFLICHRADEEYLYVEGHGIRTGNGSNFVFQMMLGIVNLWQSPKDGREAAAEGGLKKRRYWHGSIRSDDTKNFAFKRSDLIEPLQHLPLPLPKVGTYLSRGHIAAG